MAVTTQTQEDLLKTAFQSKLATEYWLNIGGREYRLVGKSIRIGRSLDNDIALEHRSSSRYHALISLQNGRLYIEDLKSRNGVRVNQKRVKRCELKDGDEIQIGDLKGVHYQRIREGSMSPESFLADFIQTFKTLPIVQRFLDMDRRKRLGLIAGTTMFILVGAFILSSSKPAQILEGTNMIGQKSQVINKPIVDVAINKVQFANCLEMEDLGNLRESAFCFNQMPFTQSVSIALNRVKRRQTLLTETRFREGKQAYENYYYDVAILKWQEVLLIAEDISDYRAEAMKGIQKAENLKKER